MSSIVQRATQPLRLIELITCVMSSYSHPSPDLTESPQQNQTDDLHNRDIRPTVSTALTTPGQSWTPQASQQPCPRTAPVEVRRTLAASTNRHDLWHWHTTICSPAVGTRRTTSTSSMTCGKAHHGKAPRKGSGDAKPLTPCLQYI